MEKGVMLSINPDAHHTSGYDDIFVHDFGVLGPTGVPLDLAVTGQRVAEAVDHRESMSGCKRMSSAVSGCSKDLMQPSGGNR